LSCFDAAWVLRAVADALSLPVRSAACDALRAQADSIRSLKGLEERLRDSACVFAKRAKKARKGVPS
jgi:hypothetical protein